jgi:DNA invertase Pin-like site-specific DNA recombinase
VACGRGIHGPGISGAKGRDKRPGLDKVLRAVARREIDMVAAWSVDRIGRSLQDLLGFLGELRATGVDLYLHQQGLDTSTPAGKALFQMMGVFAEFERAMIRERGRAGLERAKAQGKKLGRRRNDDPKLAARVPCVNKTDTSADVPVGTMLAQIAAPHGHGRRPGRRT